MFESVARQMQNKSLCDHQILRLLVSQRGRQFASKYQAFLSGNLNEYFSQLQCLSNDGAWNLEIGDLVTTILADVIRLKIVVIRSGTPPQHFPDDGKEIDENTIVIAQNDSHTHYNATRLLTSG